MKKLTLIAVASLLSLLSFAGNYSIEITIKGLPSTPLLLTDFYGDKNRILDTVITDMKGKAIFSIPENQHPGMYKIVCGEDKYIDFIFNKENIIFETALPDIQAALKVVQSTENQIYFSYLRSYKSIKDKITVLQQLPNVYQPTDAFSKQFTQEYYNRNDEITSLQKKILNENPNSYAYKMIKVKTETFPELGGSAFIQSNYVRSNWFKNTDFNDTMLFYSNAFTTKVIGYLQLFASKYYNKDQQLQVFKTAIDSILTKTKANRKTYNFIVDFMINGFEEMGNPKLVEFIASRYSDEQSCEHDGTKTTLERKILSYTKLKIGTDAPTFDVLTEKGTKVTLNDYANRTVMLVFWATWCPHCQQTLPEIKKIFDTRIDKSFEFITIALDTNKIDWKDYIKTNNFTTSQNVCDGKSWDGKIATDYQTYSTPSIFIIQNKKIIGKPNDLESLKDILKEAKIIQ
jgi:thiol-disulfide isomerase/thioredoxin